MAKSKILVVDDELGLLRLMALMLSTRGPYDVRSESDATQALAAARDFKPDLVILDWIMPDLSGADVAKLIKDDPSVSTTPILVLSAVIPKSGEIK